MIIEFKVKSDSNNNTVYKVTFQKNNEHVYAGCNCNSRKGGLACKHILNILDGDVTNIIESNYEGIKSVLQLAADTRFIRLFDEYKAGLKTLNLKTLTTLKREMVTKP